MTPFHRLLEKLEINFPLDKENHVVLKTIQLNRKTSDLHIVFQSTKSLTTDLKALLKNRMVEYLNEYKVHIDFILSQDSYRDEMDLIEQVILNYNPSATVWLGELEINLDKKDKTLLIMAPNEEIYHAFNRNGLKKILEHKLKCFDDYQVKFLKPNESYTCNINQFIESLEEEEKLFSQELPIQRERMVEKKPSIQSNFKYGKKTNATTVELKNLHENYDQVTVIGDIFKMESKELKSGKFLVILSITDYTSSTLAKLFLGKDKFQEFNANVKKGQHVLITGKVGYDNFSKCDNIMISYFEVLKPMEKMDQASEKRVELRVHTKMSTMNGVSSFDAFAERASFWEHPAIAITDKADVQGFPEAMSAGAKHNIKILYGMDGNFVDDQEDIITHFEHEEYEDFIVFDIETTGLSIRKDAITEIGAVKIKNGQIVDRFSQLVNPEQNIPLEVSELTGITNAMVENEPKIKSVIHDFYHFCEEGVLVAHNAKFDTSFIRKYMKREGLEFHFPILDTLPLARATVTGIKRFNLGTICKKLGVTLVGAHRAVNDAQATAEVFLKIMSQLKKQGITTFSQINRLKHKIESSRLFESSISILAQNQVGLKNLYQLVSKSHMDYYHIVPKIPRSLIDQYREGLLLGSGNAQSLLFDAVYRMMPEKDLLEIASYYDYLEIQPSDNNIPGILQGKYSLSDIMEINREIVRIGEILQIPVVATSDPYYLDPKDDISRRIILNGKSGRPDEEARIKQNLYFRSTDEMLKEFRYLGEEKAYQVVIKNTHIISNLCDNIEPIPKGTYPPVIEGSEEDLRKMTYQKAREIYGEELPELVEKRLEKELDSIITNGYAVLYIIAQKLVKKSNDDGYLVGSRGSVGSSFAATMAGITEVNPLPPHYICPHCKHSEFYDDPSIGSGVDLDDKDCPKCGHALKKDGHNIPFEVFLGFNGDKEPDIDLNFAGQYQANAHKYTEDLFGEGYVFRAGTIGTVAEKTAYGYVKKFFEDQPISPIEVERLALNCEGVKRTSGQHPGGVMICPKNKSIFDFTPIQYPADDASSGVITTHFDYNFIHGKILKLDILGHDGPTIIKMLEDLTSVDSEQIPLDDEKTTSLFRNGEALNMDPNILQVSTGTLGIPEFGTDFVRQMLVETQPKTFADLVRISGLSHGTDVWLGNAQVLIREGRAHISEVISTREDIMVYLIQAGAENKMAFDTMEKVRKGKGLTEEQKKIMSRLDLPPWYMESCEKIQYMFPKAHAVAYVMLSFRIAYFKLNYPLAFYATHFSMKLSDFDGGVVLNGVQGVKDKMEIMKNQIELTTKDENQMKVFEVVLEMFSRGYEFLPIDIYHSEASIFTIEENKIRMPIRALSGIGETIAENIVIERKKGEFISIEDLCQRTKATKSVVSILEENNLLNGLQETNQINLFNLF
ncbi:MAG: PolC-type DNA polymerase III [Tissierellia bacterium]|nr:PolC-type DNA polymerase III [Tissierellia bacterium]